MSWLELRLDARPEQTEGLEDALLASGALAVTYTDAGDQPILEPGVGEMPLWPEVVLVGLYEADTNTDFIRSTLEHLSSEPLTNPRWDILESKVWEREWLQHHQPVKFGNAFWVYHQPVNQPEDTDASETSETTNTANNTDNTDNTDKKPLPTLLLDPGLAFGTGTHPTTALCLEWIAAQNWHNKNLIDFGCGSGILAIAACLLGARSACCTDIDGQALAATRDNARRNAISNEQLQIFLAGQEPQQQADALVANILAGPLVELAESLMHSVKAGGQVCLSGILAVQEHSIRQAYTPYLNRIKVEQQDDWLRVSGQRKPAEGS